MHLQENSNQMSVHQKTQIPEIHHLHHMAIRVRFTSQAVIFRKSKFIHPIIKSRCFLCYLLFSCLHKIIFIDSGFQPWNIAISGCQRYLICDLGNQCTGSARFPDQNNWITASNSRCFQWSSEVLPDRPTDRNSVPGKKNCHDSPRTPYSGLSDPASG